MLGFRISTFGWGKGLVTYKEKHNTMVCNLSRYFLAFPGISSLARLASFALFQPSSCLPRLRSLGIEGKAAKCDVGVRVTQATTSFVCV